MGRRTTRAKSKNPSRIPDEIPEWILPTLEEVLFDYRYVKSDGLSQKQQDEVDKKRRVLVEYDARTDKETGWCDGGLESFCKKHEICRKTLFNWIKRRDSDLLLAGCHVNVQIPGEAEVYRRSKKGCENFFDARFVWEALKIKATLPNLQRTRFAEILQKNLFEIGHYSPGFHTLYEILAVLIKRPPFVRCISSKRYLDKFELRLRCDHSEKLGTCGMDESTTCFILEGEEGARNQIHFAIAIDYPTRFAWLKWKRGHFDSGDVMQLSRSVLLPGKGEFADIVYPGKVFISDKAGIFASEEQHKAACTEAGIEKREVTPYKSHQNGLVERLNGRIKEKLKEYQIVVREENKGKCEVIYLRYSEEELGRVFKETLREYLLEDKHSEIGTTPYLKFLEVYGKKTIAEERIEKINSAFRLRTTAKVRNTDILVSGKYWCFDGMERYIGQTIQVRITPEGDSAEAYASDGKTKLGALKPLPKSGRERQLLREINRDRTRIINAAVRGARKSGIRELPENLRIAAERGQMAEKNSCPSRKGYVNQKTPQRVGKSVAKRMNKLADKHIPETPPPLPQREMAFTPTTSSHCQNHEVYVDSW